MPCAMSSLRGASGVVGCDRVVCPLVLHATTIAHLDVRLCTDLFFLLRVLCVYGVPCSCVPLSLCLGCGAVAVCPALCSCACVVGVCVAVCGAVAAPLSCPACGTALSSTLPVTHRPCNSCPYIPCIYGVYIRLSHTGSYIVAYFRLAIFTLRSVHIVKANPLESEYGFQKVGLNFRCFILQKIFRHKIPALYFRNYFY